MFEKTAKILRIHEKADSDLFLQNIPWTASVNLHKKYRASKPIKNECFNRLVRINSSLIFWSSDKLILNQFYLKRIWMKSLLNTNPQVLLRRGGVVVDILSSCTDAWNEWIGRSGSTAESGGGWWNTADRNVNWWTWFKFIQVKTKTIFQCYLQLFQKISSQFFLNHAYTRRIYSLVCLHEILQRHFANSPIFFNSN